MITSGIYIISIAIFMKNMYLILKDSRNQNYNKKEPVSDWFLFLTEEKVNNDV